MLRRSFIQAMLAAFATPVTGSLLPPLPNAAATKINYDLFTEGWSSHRYDLHEPFVLDDTLFATDSKILISHAAEDGAVLSQDRRFPDLKYLPFSRFEESGWVRLRATPDLVPYKNQTETGCPVCFGTTRVGSDVRRCPNMILFDGDDCSIMGCAECSGCGWIGGTLCGFCREGYVLSNKSEKICGIPFDRAFAAKLRLLGTTDVRLFPFEHPREGQSLGVLGFRFDAGQHGEGRGLLMPLYK